MQHTDRAIYRFPGFAVGIPALPWIMPYFIGAILLRRFGGKPTAR